MSYVLGGDNTYDGAKAHHPWELSAGHFGALELAVRVSRIALDQHAFPLFADAWKSARAAFAMGMTVSWIFGRLFRAVAGFERTQFEGGAGSQNALLARPSEYALITRLTLNL